MPIRARMALIVASLFTIASCTVGSGDLATESRPAGAFDEVVLETSGSVIIDVTGTESIEIEADDNVLPLLTSDVVDGRLELGTSGPFGSSHEITYRITASRLARVEIAGSGDMSISGLAGGAFAAAIGGSGTIDASGTCDALDVVIGGSGDFKGEDLECITGSVSVGGSGHTVVNVTDDLAVQVGGSGDVEYLGSPNVDQHISGSGEVTRR